MRTLEGVYKAVCLGVDNQGEVIRCQVPQIFNDETVTCFDVAGGVFPIEGDEGWVLFESGYPDHPIWLASSEGISSPDVTPGVGVIDVSAGVGIAVTPGQHPVVTNMGVLSVVAGARVTINNTNAQIPVVTANPQYAAGGALDTLLAKNSAADYDTKWVTPASLGFLPLSGGTMTGAIVTMGGGNEVIKIPGGSGYFGFWNGGTREGYLQGHAGGMTLSADIGDLTLGSASGRVALPASLNLGYPVNYGSAYGGLNWSNGNYIIMSNGGDTFITAPGNGGGVSIRGGVNNGYQLNINSNGNHGIIGNLNFSGYSIDGLANLNASGVLTCRGFNLAGTNSFYHTDFGGGWYMTDGTYIRSTNDKHVWAGGGWFSCDGAISCGWGGVSWRGYKLDINGDAYVNQLSTGHIDTRDGARVTSNGGYNGWYYNSSVFCQKYSSGDRADVSWHPGGVAYNLGATPNSASSGLWTLDSGWYSSLTASDFIVASTERYKQDLEAWPPKSLSAAGVSAVDRLRTIRVIRYRMAKEHALKQALPVRRQRALERLNRWRDTKRLERYEQPWHDCDEHDCTGTNENPCPRVLNWLMPHVGITVENLVQVLPEAVQIGMDYKPEGMRTSSMLGYLLAVCQEQQERIDYLETNLGPRPLGPGTTNALEAA